MKKVFILFIMTLFLVSCKKEEKELSCTIGELEDGKCKVVETMDVSKKCREGYSFNEENGKCENTITIAAKKVSTCPDGYFIGSDNWCFSEKEYPKEIKLNCESSNIAEDDKFSTTYEKDNKCIEKICTKVSEDGEKCEAYKETELKAKVEESCPSGMKNDDGVCRKKYWMNKKYSCDLGEKVGNNCIINDSIDMDLYCENDEYKLNDEKNICEKTTYYEAVYK